MDTQPRLRAAAQVRTHRLAEPHLVSQDAVESVLEEADQPGHTRQLVVTQLTLNQGDQGLCGGGSTDVSNRHLSSTT